jgi:dienelactone hydrolase
MRLVLAAPTCALALIAAFPSSPARAAIPPPASVTNRVLTTSGNGVGELVLRVAYSAGGATATATPSPLRLALGNAYRVRTCIWTKAPQRAPASTCEQAQVRPALLDVVTGVTVPGASMTVDRPSAGTAPATIAGTVLVDVRRSDGRYDPSASSWPGDGLPAAGLVVPAVDGTAGPVLAPQGVALSGARGGGIDNGTQDSICREEQPTPTDAPGGSTDALGELPFAYEVGEPAGGQPARGVMLVLHGGAWFSVGEAKLGITRPDAARWQARGWRTVNATYRACATSVDDVLRLYDRVRSTYGATLPVCAFGRSAGGHLALLLAARRPQLACVVAEAGIADLAALAGQAAVGGASGPATVANWATAAFGADRLAQVSAAGSAVRARVLYAISAADPLVPFEQATAFAAAQRRRDPGAYVDTLRVPAGDEPFEHVHASVAGLQEFFAREQALVAPWQIGDVSVPARARLRVVRANGLRLRFSCASRCTVAARLELGAATARRLGIARVAGRGAARRSTRGGAVLTLRLAGAARGRIRAVTARVVSDVTAGGARRRQTARIALRRP